MSSSPSWIKLNVCTKLGSLQQRLFFQGQRNIIQILILGQHHRLQVPARPIHVPTALRSYSTTAPWPRQALRFAAPAPSSLPAPSSPVRVDSDPTWPPHPLPPYPPSPRQLRSRRPSSLPSRFSAPAILPLLDSFAGGVGPPCRRASSLRRADRRSGRRFTPPQVRGSCFHAPAAAATARQYCGYPRLSGADALISHTLRRRLARPGSPAAAPVSGERML